MWQRFTEKARKVVFYAQEEAGIVGQNQVGPEHLLAGLVRDDHSVAVRLLVNLNISPQAIQSELARRMARGTERLGGDMQLTASAKRVIDSAYNEARRLNNNYIGTEHLLLGLLRDADSLDPENLAAQILREFAVDLEAVRAEVRLLHESNPSQGRQAYAPQDEDAVSPPMTRASQAFGSSTASVNRIAHTIIQQAIREGATDVHVEPTNQGVRIQYRIDGVRCEIMSVPDHLRDPLIACFKTLADLDPARSDIPQHGRMKLRSEGKYYDLVIHALRIAKGEKIVIRLLQDFPVGLAELGFLDDGRAALRTWTARRSGLVLLAGSTGSGKTTTAYNLLREIASSGGHIIAIQDPLEQTIPDVDSILVDTKSCVTLETALDIALRDQPDAIFVGSVLSHSFGVALRRVLDTALSGPLVFLDYHAPSAANALNRFLSHEIPMRLINDGLIGVVGHSLARRVCENCKMPIDQTLSSQMRDESRHAGFDPPADVVFTKGAGCAMCRNTGYKGRIGLYELLTWNKSIAEATQRQATAIEITELAVTQGMTTCFADGIRKATLGLTTVEEIERVAFRPTSTTRHHP